MEFQLNSETNLKLRALKVL